MYHLNELNVSLQGQQRNVITAREKLKAFKLKLSLWSSRIAKDNLANLPSLNTGFPNQGCEMAFSVLCVVLKIISLSVPFALIVQRILC